VDVISRLIVLVRKEMIDHKTNMSIWILSMMPILVAQMYRMMDISVHKIDSLLSIHMSMTGAILTTAIMGILITDEKDQNTLRTLMLSGVKSYEILLGKGLMTLLITTGVSLAGFMILQAPYNLLLPFLLVSWLLGIIMILIGSIIGLYAKNQTQVGIIGTPITMFFYMVPTLDIVGINIGFVEKFVPTYHTTALITQYYTANEDVFMHYMMLVVWLVLLSVLLVVFYSRRKLTD
jgi:ABC-2 type transport system permease protein